jgi:hypothetical protein
MNEEAISEVLGYLFIFGIIVTAIAIVYAYSIPALYTAEDAHYLRNVDQSFLVLHYNANRIVTGSAPSQIVEVKIKDSSLGIYRKSELNLSFYVLNETSLQYEEENIFVPLLTVEHSYDDRNIAYEGGGVWVSDGGVAMLAKPIISIGNTTVIPVAAILGNNSSIGGTAIVRIQLENWYRVMYGGTTIEERKNITNLTLQISSDYCRGWRTYFYELGFEEFEKECEEGAVAVNVTKKVNNFIDLYLIAPYISGKVY